MDKETYIENKILSVIRSLVQRKQADAMDVTVDTVINQDLDLDSFDWAEIIIMVSEEVGSDPFQEGLNVSLHTLGDFIKVYKAVVQ